MDARRTSLAAAAIVLSSATAAVALVPEVRPGELAPLRSSAVATAVAPTAAPAPAAAADASPAPDPTAAKRLGDRVARALAGSTARTIGASVEVDGLGVVYRREAHHPLPPASTQKSFVALAALLAAGEGERYRTTLSALSEPLAGVVHGNLWLYGSGDPYLTRLGLESMARDLKAKGVRVVTGDLLLDDSRYDAKRRADGWKASFMPGQSGPLSSLAVDRNAGRRDRPYLNDPAIPNAVLLRDAMRKHGIRIGTVRRNRVPSGAVVLAERTSGPMSAVVARMMKNSDNFAAELVLKEVGRRIAGRGTSLDGLAAVREVLGADGVPVGSGTDGSGLSYRDRQTAAGEVALLAAADASAVRSSFRASLPLACRSGTLRKRFCRTAAEGRLNAKTGTLSGVRALSGYTKTRSGRVVRFSFILTGVSNGAQALAAMDRAGVVLASATE